VRNANGDWFEGPVPVPLIMAPGVRPPVCAVRVIGANFAEVAERDVHEGDIEGTAVVTGTWTGSALRVQRQVSATQPDEAEHGYWDRPPRTLRFPWTRRELEDVRSHIHENWAEWNIYSMGITNDHMGARLTRVLPAIAAWAATLPTGILALDPWLTPVASRARVQHAVHRL